MKPNFIRAKLVEKGISLKEIALKFNVDSSFISHIIAGRRHNQEIEKHISELIKTMPFYKRMINIIKSQDTDNSKIS